MRLLYLFMWLFLLMRLLSLLLVDLVVISAIIVIAVAVVAVVIIVDHAVGSRYQAPLTPSSFCGFC